MNSAMTTSNAPRWKRNQTGDVNALPSFRYVVRTAGEGASISDRASSRVIARAYAGRREPLQVRRRRYANLSLERRQVPGAGYPSQLVNAAFGEAVRGTDAGSDGVRNQDFAG